MHSRGDRLRPDPDPGDEQVVALLESSALVRRADRAVQLAATEIRSSVVAATLRRVTAGWLAVTPAGRRFSIGLTRVVAALVNVVLTSVTGSIPGWLWTVIPGLAAAIGVVMMMSGAAARAEQQ